MWGIFLDIETTGLSSLRHRALEIAIRLVDLRTGEALAALSLGIRQPLEVWQQASPDSLLVNGYTWEKCCQGIPEADAADQIISFLAHWTIHRSNSVFICQNPSFDRGFFSQLID